MQYSVEAASALLASPFVDDAQFAAALGGGKQDEAAIRRYLGLPNPARPDVAPYFDRAWYWLRYPDILESDADPLLHYLGWGAAEKRSPHPLIDIGFIATADPDAVPEPFDIEALLDLLDNDRIDPSRWFDRDFYRTQLDGPRTVTGGLLRHFLAHGLRQGLKPAPGIDPVAAYRQARGRSLDVRDGLRHLALPGSAPRTVNAEPPAEPEAKALFEANARALIPTYVRGPFDFRSGDAPPALSVVVVARDRFALTMGTLASLRANFAGAIDLILVDSGSTDEVRQIGRYVLGAQILRFAENVGFLRGCNAALPQAQAEALLYLNNDVELVPGAVEAALRRLHSDPAIGAVGAKIVRSHGLLQEAGSIVWRNGETAGYLRDAQPLAPEANFVRDVDYCSAACLLVRTALVQELGGFDEAFAPAYYEDVDLCLRITEAGYRVVYDPAVLVRHLEYGSSADVESAMARITANRAVFFRKHMGRLRFRYTPDARAQLFARNARPQRGRVLFIEDQPPVRSLGQGFVRSSDIVRTLAAMGYHVTVFPLHPGPLGLAAIHADMPDTVEMMHDRLLADLEAFLKARRGYYDTIWICRTHNLDQVKPALERGGTDVLGGVRIVLDTEAIASVREAARRALTEGPGAFDLDAAIREEFANAWFCQSIVAVNAHEAVRLRQAGFPDVAVLGHGLAPRPTPRGFAERSGMLFVGALGTEDSPNLDGLRWFVDEVLPLVEVALRHETRLTVAGFAAPGIDLSRLAAHPRITLLGPVAELEPLYARHRVAIAPTRFAAGIPYKVHEAASFGVPVVTTDLLAEQLDWKDGRDLLAASAADPRAFAQAVVALSRDGERWSTLRQSALRRLTETASPAHFAAAVEAVLNPACVSTETIASEGQGTEPAAS